MPTSRQGEAYKFSKPFEGPFRITSLYDNGADLKSIDKSKSKVIRVALDRIRKCPKEICSQRHGIQRKLLKAVKKNWKLLTMRNVSLPLGVVD